MMRVGLSQRVCVFGAERRDCLDQAWSEVVRAEGNVPVPLPNARGGAADLLDALGVDVLVLTGGNDLVGAPGAVDTAPERDRFERAALEWAVGRAVPVLGVCRGLQLLATVGGAGLVPVAGHVGGMHALVDAAPGLPTQVNSFHRFAPTRAGDGQQVLARSPDGAIEALRAGDGAAAAVMWHPERAPRDAAGRPVSLLETLLAA